MADCVRSGKPEQEVNKQETAEEFFPELAAAIFPMNYAIAQMVVEKLKLSELKLGARVLDIAAGSGVWSIPVAESNNNVTIDAVDFPAVLQVTRKFAMRHNVAPQFNYIAKDWRQITLEPNSYDVIIIGHLLHSEGKESSETLLGKVNPALKEGGWVVIGEFLTNEERTAPAVAVLFAINMYLQTTQGCVFTYLELKEMLENTAYKNVERLTLPMFGDQSPVVVAQRK
jgi:ubiquinone/menaquinone biosynthesis C-methylase UbiE